MSIQIINLYSTERITSHRQLVYYKVIVAAVVAMSAGAGPFILRPKISHHMS